MEIDAEGLVNGGDDFTRGDGALGGVAADVVGFADDFAAFDAAAGEVHGPAVRPVVATTSGIDLGRAAEFREAGDHGVVEHAALEEVLDEGAVALVIHRRDDVAHAFDAGEGLGAVDVPGDLAKHGDKGVHCDETHATLDEATREQAALTEAVQPVALAHFERLFGQVEGLAGLGAGHDAVGGLEIRVHELRLLAVFEIPHAAVHQLAELLAAFETHLTDFLRREQIGHFEVLFRRIRVQDEGIIRLAEEARVLTMRHVAAGGAHRLRQDDVRREIAAAALEELQSAADVRGIHATGEKAARLHHLMPGVMHRSGGVVAGAHEAEFVRDLRMQRQDLGDLEGIALRADRLERAANLARRIRLHVPEILLARRPEVEDHDAGLVALFGVHFAFRPQFGETGHREADGAQSTGGDEIAA